MMNRDGLVDYLTNQFQKPMDYKEKYIELYNRYHIPEGMSSDALTLRKDLGEYSNYILFCLLSVINPKKLKDYFVDVEIDTFSVTKYEEEGKIELPILIKNMVAVSSDQFIGSVTMQWLMKLGDAQFVNYNAATQRTLKREIKGNAEYYRPYVNRKSVRDIADSMRRGSYIPNVMTFNMPEDTDYEYMNGILRVNHISKFDITDGYHRYLAMRSIYNEDHSFDYPMEIRITSFPINKAQHFIWQEDQGTKMKKIDSSSLNQYDPANIIIQKLNANPMFNLHGEILRIGGIIKSGDLSNMITYFFFRHYNKNEIKVRTLNVSNILFRKFNILTENDHEFLTEPYSWRKLVIVMYVMSNTSIADQEMISAIHYLIDQIKTIPTRLLDGKHIRLELIAAFDHMILEWRKKK